MSEKLIVGAMHKDCINDFTTNLMLEILTFFMAEKAGLRDLPDNEEQRKIIARALTTMRKEGYKPLIRGDMVIFEDVDGVPLYQRNTTGTFLTGGELPDEPTTAGEAR